MAKFADRVKETSTTTGTGTLDLGGPIAGFRGFVDGHGDGEFVPSFVVVHTTEDEWENNSGTVTDAATDTLSRGTPFASSNSGSLVDFSAGTKHVFSTVSAFHENNLSKVLFARVASSANVDLANDAANGDTINSVTIATEDIVAYTAQTDASENGLYVTAASGTPTRVAGLQVGDNASEAVVFVREGSNAGLWQCDTAAGSDVVGTDDLSFTNRIASPSDHGALSGLTDDDHTQYILADGTRAFSAGILADEITTPSTPASGKQTLYPKTDGWYALDDAGVETGPFVTSTGGAPTNAQFVVVANDATLTAERVLQGIDGIDIVDGGAGGNISVKLDFNNLTEDTSPDAANDGVASWDSSASTFKFVKYENLPSGQPFSTATAHFKDSTDTTKQVRVLADDITTGTTRTLNMPDANIDLTADGTGTFAPVSGSLGTGDTADDVKQWNGSAWINKQLDAGDIKSGQLAHERGGIEADISAVAIGDVIAGTGSGTMGLVTATGHSDGDVLTIQADGSVDFETPAGGGGGMSDLVDDTTPQLGGDLDCNGSDILMDSGNAIRDENGNEQIQFVTTPSAVNHLTVSNSATGNQVAVATAGDDANITLNLQPSGTGNIILGQFVLDADQSVTGSNDNHVLTYDNGTGLISLEAASIDTLSDDLDTNGNNIQFDAGNGIHDDDDNEQLIFAKTSSAVNHWQMTNLSTGSGPKLSAVGDDTNIDARIEPKGSGDVVLGNYTLDGDQSVGAGQDDYVLTYDNGTGLISLEAAAGGSGSLFGLTRTAVKSSAYTAAVGDLVPINASGFSANVDFTFPATIAAGDVWGYYLEQAHTDHMATINRDSNTINGATVMWSGGPDIDEKYSLCLRGDCVVFMATSSSDAVCIYDGITPHVCTITKTSTQGSMTQNTWIEITMDTTIIDIGNLADTSNNRIQVRRPGLYDGTAFIKWNSVPDTTHCGVTVWQTDTSGAIGTDSLIMSMPANGKGATFDFRIPPSTQRFKAVADDHFTAYGAQSDATAGTVAGQAEPIYDNPRLNILEIR